MQVLGTKLLQNYPVYRMTLSDRWPRFQGHDIFGIEYLRNNTR